MSIPFTQYLRPDGRQRPVFHQTTLETEAKAKALIGRGAHFDIEELINGTISMTCEIEDEGGETVILAAETCANGPEVVAATIRLVDRASHGTGQAQVRS